MTLDVPPSVVDETAALLDASNREPTDAAVRDAVYTLLEVRPEFRADGRPVADAVRARLDAGK